MLIRTRTAFGGHNILDDEPRLTVVRNAMVIGWALYDDRRLLVPDSAFAREGVQSGQHGLSTIGANTTTNRNIRAGHTLPDGTDYVWIGHLHQHFGHFLISTVSRLWSIARHAPDAKIVTAGPGTLDQTLSLPFVGAILNALGINADRFVEVQDGVIIPKVIVPEALLVENSAAHKAFSSFAIDLAERLAGPTNINDHDDRPLFLSKHALRQGVRTIDGEAEFAAVLQAAGVVTASPEQLELADQIKLWRRHPIIVSFEGSAGHNAIFVRNKKLLSLSSNPFAPSNQVLIDAVADHQCLYLNCASDMTPGEPRPGFKSALRLIDPEVSAHSVLNAIAYLRNCRETMHMRAMSDTLSPVLFLDEPFGGNLSRGRPCDMSSVDPVWKRGEGTTTAEAAGAVSGALSATYQMHSRAEQGTWWQVNLERRCLVTEIRVYNRNDVARERSRHLMLSCSNNGSDWVVLARREQIDDFGGGDLPVPWRWWSNQPFEARLIRIDLPGPDFLHLDQVEVFGFEIEVDTPTAF